MEEEKKKRGGARPGAGRPSKSGCPTVVMRVPAGDKIKYETLIRITNEWVESCSGKTAEITLDKAEEEARASLLQRLKYVIDYEEKRSRRAKKKRRKKRTTSDK